MKRAPLLLLLSVALGCGSLLPFVLRAAPHPPPPPPSSPEELYASGCWRLADPPPGKITWVEIHNGPEALASGVAHVRVLARRKGAPAGELEHVCPHLAITTAALQRSVTRPYKTREAYPESFLVGYGQWKEEQRQTGTAFVCTTSVQDFLQRLPAPRLRR